MAETPAELSAVAFPTLSEEELAEIAECPKLVRRRFRDGERLFESGDADVPLFIIVSGAIEIIDETGDSPKTLVVHHRGQFTGEVGWLSGARALATGRRARRHRGLGLHAGERARAPHRLAEDRRHDPLARSSPAASCSGSRSEFTGLRVIGSRYSRDTFRIRDFLSRNRLLFTYLDIEENPDVAKILEHLGLKPEDTPVVAFGCKLVLRNPSDAEIARQIGIKRPLEQTVYDLAVVGGGPSGLAAAVYAASEDLKTVVLERSATGGQAGSSMRIENYLGFPTGLTGAELADRAVVQANKFGAVLSVPTPVVRLRFDNAYCVLELEGGETITAKSLLIASGAAVPQARGRRLRGLRGARRLLRGDAERSAVLPRRRRRHRGRRKLRRPGGGLPLGLRAQGPPRLPRRIAGAEHVGLPRPSHRDDAEHRGPGPHRGRRDAGRRSISARSTCVRRASSGVRTVETAMLFSFIGATPHTDWLPPEVERDERQFVRTGQTLASSPHWKLKRPPFLLETSRPGVFAAGDVRAGSVKRVASAVGEGSMAVQFVHEFLKEM